MFAPTESLLINYPIKNRACQNIGRIAQFVRRTVLILRTSAETLTPRSHSPYYLRRCGGCYGFDTGPGTVFIDSVVRHFMEDKKEYDMDGVIGANGKVDRSMLDEMLQ